MLIGAVAIIAYLCKHTQNRHAAMIILILAKSLRNCLKLRSFLMFHFVRHNLLHFSRDCFCP